AAVAGPLLADCRHRAEARRRRPGDGAAGDCPPRRRPGPAGKRPAHVQRRGRTMNEPQKAHPPDCDCCSGVGGRTPGTVANFPGQPSLAYRVGTYADFFATMLAHVSAYLGQADRDETQGGPPVPVADLLAAALAGPRRGPSAPASTAMI